jgi:hypothetical protein
MGQKNSTTLPAQPVNNTHKTGPAADALRAMRQSQGRHRPAIPVGAPDALPPHGVPDVRTLQQKKGAGSESGRH